MSLKPDTIEKAYKALAITREDMTRRIRNSAKDMAIGFAITDAKMPETLAVLDRLVVACHQHQAILKILGHQQKPITLRALNTAGILRWLSNSNLHFFEGMDVKQIEAHGVANFLDSKERYKKYARIARQIALAVMIVQETDRFRRVPEFEIDSTAEAANERADRALEARAGSERGVSTYFGGLAKRRPRRENLSP